MENDDETKPRMWTFTAILSMGEGPTGGETFSLKTAEGPEILVGITRRGGAAEVIIMDGSTTIDQYEGPAAMGLLYFAQNTYEQVRADLTSIMDMLS